HTAPPEIYTLSLHDALPISKIIVIGAQQVVLVLIRTLASYGPLAAFVSASAPPAGAGPRRRARDRRFCPRTSRVPSRRWRRGNCTARWPSGTRTLSRDPGGG